MEKFAVLVNWLKGDPKKGLACAGLSSKLDVIDDPTMGRCIIATAPIGESEQIVTIPHSYMMNYVTVLLHLQKWNRQIDVEDLRFGHIYIPEYKSEDDDEFSKIYRKLDPKALLQLNSFQLISFYLVMERNRGEKSFWKPFLDVQPLTEELSGMPFTWIVNSDNKENLEIFQMLPEDIKKHANEQLRKFDEDYSSVIELITGLCASPESVVPKDLFLWAWISCNSRCLYMNLPKKLNKTIEDNFTLVPYVDFLNHQIDDHCGIEISSQKGFQVNTNQSSYSKGDQLYFSYGAHDDNFLLCEYGFMFQPGFNFWNYIDISNYVIKLMKPVHIKFLQSMDYYGDYTLTKESLSFRTTIAMATIQEPESNFSMDGIDGFQCSSNLQSLMDGVNEGVSYKRGTDLLIKKILGKIQANSEKIIGLIDDMDAESNPKYNIVKSSHLNILDISKAYL